ncbi:MAG: ATP-dependent Clp protease ATP-binding subunit [Clostridiaceae bacterium]|nr:ATP-dependent Clp protease ATP-binding subunit [Clostridiaceae bacterium]
MAEGVFTPESQRVLIAAFTAARGFAHSCLCSEHLLLGLCSQSEGVSLDVLEGQGITREVIEREILASCGRGVRGTYTAEVSREAAEVLEDAAKMAAFSENGRISPDHMLLAMLRNARCGAYRLIRELGADTSIMASMLARPSKQPGPRKPRTREPKLLLQYGCDMTQKASRGEYDRLVGREKELERVTRVLCRRRKANPVLLGEAGVGKTAIAEGMAALITTGKVPPPLKGTRLFSIDMATIVSGTKYRGEFEDKIRAVIDEASSCGDIILFIDELHTVAGAGAAEGAIDAGNILKPALARGNLRILGATTPAEYRKYIAKDAALERRFQPIDIGEPDREATLAILRSSAALCRRYYGVEAGEDMLLRIELMCRRFLPQRYFPDKAIDVLEEASALALTEGDRRLDGSHIKRVVSQMSGLNAVTDERGIVPKALELKLKSQIMGQDKAIETAVSTVASALAFPGGKSRPQGVMLFCGPSGIGKTMLAKKLAENIFGDEKSLVRFDMSEYREPHSVSRLIGAPPGYLGYGTGGLLTEAVQRKPFSVLLFDEIEKAHFEVLNLLLQLLEDGVLTDSEGVKADFKSAIIIMTSNIGFSGITGRKVGFGGEGRGDDLKRALSQSFSPELLGRIDKVVLFEPLDAECLEKIAVLGLEDFASRLSEEGMTLEWDKEVPALISAGAKDGRDVRSAVSDMVEQPLALMCLNNGRPHAVRLTEGKGMVCFTFDGAAVC